MIMLHDDLALKADDNCYILGKPYAYTNKAGEEITVLQSPSYHTSITHAIKCAIDLLMRRKISEGTITELIQYKAELELMQECFENMLTDNLS